MVGRESIDNRGKSWRRGGVVEVSSNDRRRKVAKEDVEVVVEEERIWGILDVD